MDVISMEYDIRIWEQMHCAVYIIEITADLMTAHSVATDGRFECIH